MNNEENLGTLISTKRKEKNLTQKELAELLHISDKAISRWETNASYPDINMLHQLGVILEIPFDKLIQFKVEAKDESTINTIVREYEKKTRKIEKKYRKRLLIVMTILSFIILLTFFTSTYDQFKLYDIGILSDDFYETIGLYVDTNMQDYIYLGSLILNEDFDEENSSVDIYIKNQNSEIILKHYDKFYNNIKFDVDKSFLKADSLERYFDNIYIRIKDHNSNKEYIGKFNFILRFSNNKIFYFNNNEDITKNNDTSLQKTKKKLEELGFEESKDKNIYVDGSGKFQYNLNGNYLIYQFNDTNANLKYKYKYYFKLKKIAITISSFNNNEEIVIENYTYDINGDKVDCQIGQCLNYKKVLQFLDEYIKELS